MIPGINKEIIEKETGVTIDHTYLYHELYSDLKANAKTLPNANNYIFPGYIK